MKNTSHSFGLTNLPLAPSQQHTVPQVTAKARGAGTELGQLPHARTMVEDWGCCGIWREMSQRNINDQVRSQSLSISHLQLVVHQVTPVITT